MATTYRPDAQKRGFKFLTQEQVDFYLEHGYVALRGAIPPESIERFRHDVWVRLGMDPNDKSTWTTEEIHMPAHRLEHVSTFAPQVWGAICELLGGEERLDYKHGVWGNGFICNMGDPSYDKDEVIDPRDFSTWHIDGDWFRHFLDSECQALDTLILFSDVEERAGPTYISPDGIGKAAKWLLEHPEGCDNLINEKGERLPALWMKECKEFVTLTGKAGDVFLCSGLTPHTRSRNHIRNSRFITNPHVTIKEPFNFNRENLEDFSLVELQILRSLGLDRLDFKITRPRQRFRPRTKGRKDDRIPAEMERLNEYERKTGVKNDSIHKNGILHYQAAMMDLPAEA